MFGVSEDEYEGEIWYSHKRGEYLQSGWLALLSVKVEGCKEMRE